MAHTTPSSSPPPTPAPTLDIEETFAHARHLCGLLDWITALEIENDEFAVGEDAKAGLHVLTNLIYDDVVALEVELVERRTR